MDILQIINYVVLGLGAVVAGLAVIAPVTPATWDDKLLELLERGLKAVKLVRGGK